jgi:DNA invertase Pin-like site-specific DNA recombinase
LLDIFIATRYSIRMEKHVALYARTSTSIQTTGLEAQVRALRTYCQANGIGNFAVYSDEGISGTKANRPELDRLMAAVECGEVSSVIVYSFSRFARSVTHLLQALQKFEQHEVSFISVSENLDTRTSTGKFVFTILAALAALEREILVERVKTGLVNARAKGKRLGRPKKRPDDLIKELLLRGLSYRKIASIAKCSHWSIAEVAKAMRSEKKSS